MPLSMQPNAFYWVLWFETGIFTVPIYFELRIQVSSSRSTCYILHLIKSLCVIFLIAESLKFKHGLFAIIGC